MYLGFPQRTALALLFCFSALTHAGPGMSEADMQKMLEQAEAAQACYEKLDESKLEAMHMEGQKMKQEIETLCRAGNEKAANEKAIAYSKKMLSDSDFKQFQQCAKKMQGMVPAPYLPAQGNDKSASVCQQ